jgi:hypothetical protein
MIELTLEQRKAVATDAESPPRVVDPSTHTKYVLVPEEVYDRIRRLFEADENNQFVREMTPHVMELFGRDGWDDPAMDVYNELDPRISP